MRVRRAARVAVHGEIEYENFLVRINLAQVVIGSAIAQPEFEDRSFDFVDLFDQKFEQCFLGCHSTNKTVQTAH